MPGKMLNFLLLCRRPLLVKFSCTSEKTLITGWQVLWLSLTRAFSTSTAPSRSWVLAAEAACAGLGKQIKQRNSKARMKSAWVFFNLKGSGI